MYLQIEHLMDYQSKFRGMFKIFELQKLYSLILKLYCRYEYTRPYMINRIWSLKQL